jgi:tRNA U34 5-carboxymethylaminomethyl modifying GTPase MnmE/TrmE
MAGLRPAERGEFTQRAFRNGRLDLVAAEGIGDLIQAKTERQRKLALHHALGHASETIETWRRDLIAILGRVEAAIDFADEADVVRASVADVRGRLEDLILRMRGADIVIWVTAPDAISSPPEDLDSETLWIGNKSDVAASAQNSGARHLISVKTGQGMPELFASLEQYVLDMAANGESATLIRSRHKQVTASCVENLLRASAVSADHLELMAEALRAAAYDLGRLTGRIDVEEILDSIFREFCIGK